MAYEVREIYEHELQGTLDFARAMFDGQIAHSLEAQDRDEFFKSTESAAVYQKCSTGSLYVYGGFSYGALVAVAAVAPSGKIAFFFVDINYQNSGVEIELFEAIKYRCANIFRLSELYADVPQILIPMYQFLGFQFADESSAQMHSKFIRMKHVIPMQYSPIPDYGPVRQDKKRQYILLAVIIAVVVAVILAMVFVGMRIFNGVLNQVESYDPPDQKIETPAINPYDDPPPKINQEREDKGKIYEHDYLAGMDLGYGDLGFIEEHFVRGTPYSLKKVRYEVDDTSEEGSFKFTIEYPVIGGLEDEEIQDKINEAIRDCAMAQKNDMYPVISDSLLNVIDDKYYRFESLVQCKVSYLDKNVISVVFSDEYFLGSIYAEYYDIRTRTFDLRTGERCELEDLLFPGDEVSDSFIDDFRERMIAESPDSEVFRDKKVMSNDTIRRMLLGEIVDNRYYCSSFITEQGIEICATYHYRSSDDNIIARGWVTTHYNYNELLPYEKKHDLWEVLPH